MIIDCKEKVSKEFYEEVTYIESNYYIFKRNPKTKVHSLTHVLMGYVVLSLLLFLLFLFFERLEALSAMFLVLTIISIYLFVEAKYKVREYMKQGTYLVQMNANGITRNYADGISNFLPYECIETVLINRYSICFLPKTFSSGAIFVSIDAKNQVMSFLQKNSKKLTIIDNSNRYSSQN